MIYRYLDNNCEDQRTIVNIVKNKKDDQIKRVFVSHKHDHLLVNIGGRGGKIEVISEYGNSIYWEIKEIEVHKGCLRVCQCGFKSDDPILMNKHRKKEGHIINSVNRYRIKIKCPLTKIVVENVNMYNRKQGRITKFYYGLRPYSDKCTGLGVNGEKRKLQSIYDCT